MTREDLIKRLNVAKKALQDYGSLTYYENEYNAICNNVKLLTKTDKYWKEQLDFLLDYNFTTWKTIRNSLLFDVNQRDARAIMFIVRDVDLHANVYYDDSYGYVQNLNKDILSVLIERLLERLEKE